MCHRANAFCIVAALVSGAFASDASAGHDSEHEVISATPVNVCRSGIRQSPVNLKTCPSTIEDEVYNIPDERSPIALSYGGQNTMEVERVCKDMGCVLKITPHENHTNMMEVAGAEHARHYLLTHCIVRMPAEHTINGHQAPLEVQCHHTMEHTGKRRKGILSTLYMATATPSSFIAAFENNLPSKAGTEGHTNVTGAWTPTGSAGMSRYHSYSGSQTNGNCAQDVDWFVMYDPTGASQAQLATLSESMTWLPARPVQGLYGREPEGCPRHHAGAHSAVGISALAAALSLWVVFA